MKLDMIRCRNIPENWEIEYILRERDYERRERYTKTPRQAFIRGFVFGLMFMTALVAVIAWVLAISGVFGQ